MTDQEARCVRLILADREAECEALRSAARDFNRDTALGSMTLIVYGVATLAALAIALIVFTLTL